RLSLVGVDRADWQTIAQHWDGQNAPEVPDPGDDLDIVLRIFRHVGDLHDRPRQDTATGSRASARPARIHIANYLPAFRADVSLRDQVQQLAVERRYETAVGTTQAHHGPSDSIEDGLDVYRRTRDHSENFTGRSLLVEGLLGLVEQPHILDGDDGLIG